LLFKLAHEAVNPLGQSSRIFRKPMFLADLGSDFGFELLGAIAERAAFLVEPSRLSLLGRQRRRNAALGGGPVRIVRGRPPKGSLTR
jgi:hypothetical protein